MKLVLVGGMVNTLDLFRPLKEELETRGHGVTLYEGVKKPEGDTAQAVLNTIMNADLIFTGMAAPESHSDFERFALDVALQSKVRYGLLSDAAGAYKRDWFRVYREGAHCIGLRFPHEESEASRLYQKAKVAVVGHPMVETFGVPPKESRDQVRERLGLEPHDIALYVGGAKDLEMNRRVLSLVYGATAHDEWYRILFGPHPGVTGEKAKAKGVEVPFSAYREILPGIEITSPDPERSEGVIGVGRASDLAIGMDAFLFTSGTAFYAAMYRGVPPIMLNTPEIADVRDTDLSFECMSGVVLPAGNAAALLHQLRVAQTLEGRRALITNREAYFPAPPPPGTAVKLTADLLESVV